MTDQAAVWGQTEHAGGTAPYRVYAGTSCSGTAIFTDEQTMANGSVPQSGSFSPENAGT
jgi:hypothetical protein